MQLKKLFLTSISSSANTMITIEHLILLGKPFKLVCGQIVSSYRNRNRESGKNYEALWFASNSADLLLKFEGSGHL